MACIYTVRTCNQLGPSTRLAVVLHRASACRVPCGLDALLCRFSVWCSCECSAEWCTISLVPNHSVPTGVFGTNQRRHPARRTQTEQYRICRDRTIWYEHNTYRPGARYGVRSSSEGTTSRMLGMPTQYKVPGSPAYSLVCFSCKACTIGSAPLAKCARLSAANLVKVGAEWLSHGVRGLSSTALPQLLS